MSYDIVKSIVLKDNKVWLNSADSSIRPLHFHTWECTSLSKVFQESGREAVLSRIGEDVWNGEFHLYQGNKLCRLFLKAKEALPHGLNFSNLDAKAAGEYLSKAVIKLEINPLADLSAEVQELLALRNNRDYIIEAAKRTGQSFLNFADETLQKDRELAVEVLRACAGSAWFNYPSHFIDDKEFALEGLKLNGCFYRQLGDNVKADRDIILFAFDEFHDRRFHEHLPDLIPLNVFVNKTEDGKGALDKAFVFNLLDCCPSLHLERCSWMLEDRDIALKWCKVGKFFPFSASKLPEQFLSDKDFQDILIKRFKGTDKFETLLKVYANKGIVLEKGSVDELIKSATQRSNDTNVDVNKSEIERDLN